MVQFVQLTVHPRVCGELGGKGSAVAGKHGSSPRVRGTRLFAIAVLPHQRFIPACAGNSAAPWSRSRCTSGSSPRVRGTLDHGHLPGARGRFIPACAGNSQECGRCGEPFTGSSPRVRGTPSGRATTDCPATVHPRVCGELSCKWALCNTLYGSSPRVRGTPLVRYQPLPQFRFIPACAGNSAAWPVSGACPAVHPRVCGELARQHVAGGIVDRFIPACAGNSAFSSAVSKGLPVHPRVCGELVHLDDVLSADAGSSPRVRGTLVGAK